MRLSVRTLTSTVTSLCPCSKQISDYGVEIGGPLPYLERWFARAFVGYYHYSNSGKKVYEHH